MYSRYSPARARGTIAIAALILGMFASNGCTTYRLREPVATTPDALVGRTAQFAFAAESLTLKVTRVEGRLLFGRVAAGTGPAAILLSDVEAATVEDLSENGRAQNLQMTKVRRDPTVLEGANVWFETRTGNVVLRQLHVLPDGWIEGRVVSNDPTGTSVAGSSRVKVLSNAMVRIDLDRTRGYALRTVDPVQTASTTLARTLMVLVGLAVALSLLVGTAWEVSPR